MLEKFLTVAGQVVTLFLLMGVGFVLVKLGKLDRRGMGQMSELLLYVVTPCIFIEAFQQPDLPPLKTLAVSGLVMALYYLVAIPIAGLFFRREGDQVKPVMRYGTVYSNSGFMGLPLLTMVLGDQALIFGVIALVFYGIFQWTHGVAVMGGELSLKSAVLNPVVLSLLFCMVLLLFHWRLPTTVNTAVSFLADLNSPLAMVVIGGQMAGADFAATFTQPKLYLATGVKLILIPAVMLAILLPMGLPPLLFSAGVILAATPVADATGIFAQRFDKDTATAAQLITLSTLLSIFTLPVFAVLAQMLA